MENYSTDGKDNLSDDFQECQEIRVDPGQNALRIDKFLLSRLERVSRNRIQQAIRSGSVTVNNAEVKPNYKVRPGDLITLIVPKHPDSFSRVIPQEMALDIRYEDEYLLVVNKPAGLVVHPGIGHYQGTLVNGLAHYLGIDAIDVEPNNFQARLGLVHRIDKNTSGLLLVAKEDYTLSHLAKQFFRHTVERTYYAIVWGEPEVEKGSISAHVGRNPRQRKQFTAFPEGDSGKWAVTHYEMIEPMYYVSLVKCNLETGRTHQIRVHMKHLGHPLFNDERYGGDRILKGTVFSKYKSFVERAFSLMPRHALHAKTLGFTHPITGERMSFDSDLPEDFENALEAWRNYFRQRSKKSGLI